MDTKDSSAGVPVANVQGQVSGLPINTASTVFTEPPRSSDVVSSVVSEVPVDNSNQFGANDFAFKNQPKFSGLLGVLAKTRAYIPEYAVLMIITGTLIGLVNGLFSGIIDYIAEPKPSQTWGGGWIYTYSLSMLAATLVLIPVLIVLTRRIKGTEENNEDIKNNGWRRGLLGVFLIIISLTALGYSIAFLYQIVSQIAGAGLVAADKAAWKTYLKDIFAILLFGSTTWLYTRDYRYTEEDADSKHIILSKVHRYGLTLLALILVVVFNSTALSSQRNDFIDNLITEDLNTISSKVIAYESGSSKQLSSLSDLKLTDEVKSRISKYKYEYNKKSTGYQLCAVFKTDTSTKKPSDSSTGLEQALVRSSSASTDNTTTDPAVHDAGRVCFDYKNSYANQNYQDNQYLQNTNYDNTNYSQ